MKKFALLVSCSIVLISSVLGSCPFCNEEILDKQKFYEDDHIIALYSHKPVSKGHALVIPKEHKERYEELSESEIMAIHKMIRKIHAISSEHFGSDSYLLLQKNGKNVGQTVPHVHFHYIPRKINDTSQIGFIFRFYTQFWMSAMSDQKMAHIVENMKDLISTNEEALQP